MLVPTLAFGKKKKSKKKGKIVIPKGQVFTDLLKKTSLSQEQTEYLNTIEESAKNLLNSINDILDYSRLDSGTLRLEHKPFNIRNTIEQALNLQAPKADEKNIKQSCQRLKTLASVKHNAIMPARCVSHNAAYMPV